MWLGANNNFDIDRVIQSWCDLSYETDLNIELHFMDTDPVRLKHLEKIFDAKIKDQNKFRIKYMEKSDLFHDTSFNNIGNGWYDVIFTGNLLQNTQNLVQYIHLLRCILAPNGLLLLSELTLVPDYFDLIFGLSHRWWSPSGESRAIMDIKQWKEVIHKIDGFSMVQTVLGQFGTSLIIAQKSGSNQILMNLDEHKDQIWLILTDDDNDGISGSLISFLPYSNVQVSYGRSSLGNLRSTMKQLMIEYTQVHVIFAWSLKTMAQDEDKNMIFSQHEVMICDALIHMINTIEETKPEFYPFIYVLTKHAQLNGEYQFNVIGTAFVGLVRSMMMQYKSHRLKLIDLQAPSASLNEPALVTALINHLNICQNADDLDESVLCLQNDHKSVRHKQWRYTTLENRKKETMESNSSRLCVVPCQDADQQPFHLKIHPSNCHTDLCWIPDRVIQNNCINSVIVRVHSVNLSACDVLKVLGLQSSLHTSADQDVEPGSDFVGTVLHSSSDSDFLRGSRIVGICNGGALRSHIFVDPHQIICIPSVLNYITDEQIAILPTSCLTVIYALKHRVNLKTDKTVLVHSGMSVIGQICVQFCIAVGAQILVTVETEQDCYSIREKYGIQHVFSSQDLSFVQAIQTIHPKGIDVIFCSNMDAKLPQLNRLLCRQGHLIRWGKSTMPRKNDLSTIELKTGCSYHDIDITSLIKDCLPLCKDMLHEMINLLKDGKLQPLIPMATYEPSQVIEAFTQCISHEGRNSAVFRIANSKQLLHLSHPNEEHLHMESVEMFPSELRKHGTIIIAGDFFKFELMLCLWMIEQRNIKRLVFLSQTDIEQLEHEGNPQYQEWLKVKRAATFHACHLEFKQIDLAKIEQVHQVIQELCETPFPVRGIFLSANIAEHSERTIPSTERLCSILQAKVCAAWHLHLATKLVSATLQFFVLFSSVQDRSVDALSLAQNAIHDFFDGLALYRVNKLCMPAMSISWSHTNGMEDFHRDSNMAGDHANDDVFEVLPVNTIFELVEKFHVDQMISPCPFIFSVDWNKLQKQVKPSTWYRKKNLTNTQKSSSLDISSTQSRRRYLEEKIEKMKSVAASLIGLDEISRISTHDSFVSQGMRSLGAVALHNWLKKEMNVVVATVDLLQDVSIQSIAEHFSDMFGTQDHSDLLSTTAGALS